MLSSTDWNPKMVKPFSWQNHQCTSNKKMGPAQDLNISKYFWFIDHLYNFSNNEFENNNNDIYLDEL